MTKHNNSLSDKKRAFLMRIASLCSVMVAMTIITMKLFAWFLTDSMSLLSSLIDSLLDVIASLISFMAIRYALQPADEDHRFGHGKAEDLAALAQSTFVAGSGVFVLIESVGKLFGTHHVKQPEIGVIVMVVSTVLTLALVVFQRHVVKQTKSPAIKADALHYEMDIYINLIVIGAFSAVWYLDWHGVDLILAIAIAIYIFYSAWGIGKDAFDNLMDKEFSEKERQNIMDVVLSHGEVEAIHDLRTRRSGTRTFIQFHLELDGKMTLNKAHRISDEVERLMVKAFPGTEILIHQDPAHHENVPENLARRTKEKKT